MTCKYSITKRESNEMPSFLILDPAGILNDKDMRMMRLTMYLFPETVKSMVHRKRKYNDASMLADADIRKLMHATEEINKWK